MMDWTDSRCRMFHRVLTRRALLKRTVAAAACTAIGGIALIGAGNIGVPARGVEMKLVPADGKWEARLRGPLITPGYWRQPELTKAAFDEEGYYRLGDALRFVDENDVNRGFYFDGRIAEDFKLDTGTWVAVGPLRAAFIDHCAPYVQDVVIAGIDREFIAALVFPDVDSCRALAGAPAATMAELAANPRVREEMRKLLASFGGEHSLSSALVKAHVERYPNLSVLQFDAHGDLRDSYEDTPYSHACVARRIVEMCPLVQVGIRSMSAEEWEFLNTEPKPPVTTFFAQPEPLSDAQLQQMVDALSPEVYITLDLDALDPSIIAGVGTPEPGGLGWYETLRILRYVAERRRIVGFDLMEYCPAEGGTSGAFTSAKLAYKLMGYCLQTWE